MKKRSRPEVKAAIMEVVDNQLRDLDPPETKETYDRLVSSGISDEEARRLIAVALLDEMNLMVKNIENYNQERYIAALRNLPRLPWE